MLKKALNICLEEISRKSQELENLRKNIENEKNKDNCDLKSISGSVSCSLCGKKFKGKYRLNFHMKTVHESSRKFMCQHCGSTFKRLDGLKVHELKSHKIETKNPEEKSTKIDEKPSRGNFQCDICQKILSSRFNLQSHMKSFHNKDQSSYTYLCRLCGKSYATSAALRMHEKFHAMPFSCRICGKSFPDASRFKDHLNWHKEIYLKCSICGKKLSHRNSLRIHMKIHETGSLKDQKCSFCGEGFALISYLRKHQKRCRKIPEKVM